MLRMARGPRYARGGFVYHVLNRAVARLPLFEKPAAYDAFVRVLAEALVRCPMRVLAFVLMRNHWHFLLWPQRRKEDAARCFFQFVSLDGNGDVFRKRLS